MGEAAGGAEALPSAKSPTRGEPPRRLLGEDRPWRACLLLAGLVIACYVSLHNGQWIPSGSDDA
ncbi:MAG: hypothetical protein PVJ27_01380 [Candidatus Brocadiaceae bacterium]|jgi:hypothetical protein